MPDARSERKAILAVLLLLVTSGIVAWRVGAFGSRSAHSSGSVLSQSLDAPEFKGLSRWFNSRPLKTSDLRGRVTVIDFWTYSCINCIRELPILRTLYDRYRTQGLQIIGIHSPEFGFEKVPSNVERAIKERHVTWPVAMDNELATWDAFNNHYWPHVYLIDKTGRIRFDHIGEGGAQELEQAIRELLAMPVRGSNPIKDYVLHDGITGELYLGYDRGASGTFLGNADGYRKDVAAQYVLPSASVISNASNKFFLEGEWTALHESVLSGASGGIVLPFHAADVYIVAGANPPADLRVRLDGKLLSEKDSGSSVHAGILRIEGRDLYHVVHLRGVESHRLQLSSLAAGLNVYTFTFG